MPLIAPGLLSLLALAGSGSPGDGAAFSHWRLQAEIHSLPAGSEAQFVRLTLTPQILAEAQADWSDLRVVDDSGSERPYVSRSLGDIVEETHHELGIIDQGVVPERYQQVVCDLGEAERLSNEIRLETPDRDFHYQVQIFGSPQGTEWLLLRERAYLFHHQDPVASNYRVSFPETSYRFLKLVLWLEGGRPLRISAIHAVRVVRRDLPAEVREARILEITQDPDRRTTDVGLDLLLRNQHFNRARVEVTTDNFSRWAEIAYQDGQQRWVRAGASSIYRFTGEDTLEEQLLVPLSDFNAKRGRLRIWNEDNPPLQVTRVFFERPTQVLIFRPEPGRSYRLLVGNQEASRPRYDLDLAVRRLDVLELPQLGLEPLAANPGYRPSVPDLPWTERNPTLLWVGLAAGGLLLLWLLRKTLRDVNSS